MGRQFKVLAVATGQLMATHVFRRASRVGGEPKLSPPCILPLCALRTFLLNCTTKGLQPIILVGCESSSACLCLAFYCQALFCSSWHCTPALRLFPGGFLLFADFHPTLTFSVGLTTDFHPVPVVSLDKVFSNTSTLVCRLFTQPNHWMHLSLIDQVGDIHPSHY